MRRQSRISRWCFELAGVDATYLGLVNQAQCDTQLTLLLTLLFMPRDALHTGCDGNNLEDDNETSVCTPAVHREAHGTGTGDNEQNNTT